MEPRTNDKQRFVVGVGTKLLAHHEFIVVDAMKASVEAAVIDLEKSFDKKLYAVYLNQDPLDTTALHSIVFKFETKQ